MDERLMNNIQKAILAATKKSLLARVYHDPFSALDYTYNGATSVLTTYNYNFASWKGMRLPITHKDTYLQLLETGGLQFVQCCFCVCLLLIVFSRTCANNPLWKSFLSFAEFEASGPSLVHTMFPRA
jgi:hypothetical protein